jgi:hypothetical protein
MMRSVWFSVMPRFKRGIQYSETWWLVLQRFGLLVRPVKPGDDAAILDMIDSIPTHRV